MEPLSKALEAKIARTRKRYAKTLRLTSDQLKSLNLKSGANTITFSLSNSTVPACTARIFVWDSTDLVVVSDIDGTITKSDGLGHVFAMIGRDWTHSGVAKLYTDIRRNGYKIMYLTSRAIGQADSTRDYLKGIKQDDYQLPEGPVIMSPDRLMASLHREVIMRKPEVFKMACLRDIQRLFGESSRTPFYAGFGNRITDALSYRSVNVPSARIFTIDSSGEVKMELLELAGYKSSYIHMTDIVDQMFPPIHRKWAAEFTDFNYWKMPVQEFALPDLTPPSPALSARSDTSNQSTLARLRNFSLVGRRQSRDMTQFSLPAPVMAREGTPSRMGLRSSHLRQMSSLERLSGRLAALTQSSSSSGVDSRSSSSTFLDSDDEDADVEEGSVRKRRPRSTSMTSMPGSLDDEQFGMDGMDDEEEGYGNDGEVEGGENEEEAAEEAFDEDFLATGEMKNVPFL
jgi:phosphatidate phosphatase LPIN